MTQKNCKLQKIKKEPNFKVKIGKNDQTWWVQIDPARNPQQDGFDTFIMIESSKLSWHKNWQKANIMTTHTFQNVSKELAILYTEALILAIKYATEMDDAHGINY